MRAATRMCPWVPALSTGACDSDALSTICPAVETGELVLSEIRGSQDGPNTFPLFFEIYNGSARELDMAGLHLVVATPSHGSDADVIVRRRITVAAGKYFTVAPVEDEQRPPHIDYGGLLDFEGESADIYPRADVTIVACGDVIDRVVYDELPAVGSRSLMGVPPDGARNDDDDAWCSDAIESGPTGLGAPGTPGEPNRCG